MKVSKDGALSIYRENVKASSLLVDPEGRLIILGADVHGMPGMTRTDLTSGKVEVLIDRYDGKPFTGLNDITMDGKGRIYFTDRRARAVYHVRGARHEDPVRHHGQDAVQGENGHSRIASIDCR
jgi:gluconolactonase